MEDPENLWCPDSSKCYIKLSNEDGSSEDLYYSAGYRGIPEEFKIVAEKELNETNENRAKGLRRLKELIKRENLPNFGDHILIMILRNCKYNFKKSESKLKKFVRARETIVSRLQHLDIEKIEKILDDGCFGVLPFRDKHGRPILFTRPAAIDDDAYSKDDLMLTAMAFAMLVISYPLTTIAGVAYIGDGKYNSVNSYIRLMQAYHRYMWTFLDLPVRVGRIDVTNQHYLARCFISLVRPFLSSKIVSRICCYGSDLSELAKDYHPDILPDEFCGNMGPVDPSYSKTISLDFIKKLKAESQASKRKDKEKPK